MCFDRYSVTLLSCVECHWFTTVAVFQKHKITSILTESDPSGTFDMWKVYSRMFNLRMYASVNVLQCKSVCSWTLNFKIFWLCINEYNLHYWLIKRPKANSCSNFMWKYLCEWQSEVFFFLVFTLLHLWLSVITTNLTDNHSTQHRKKTTCAKITCGLLCWFLLLFCLLPWWQNFTVDICIGNVVIQIHLHTGSACETLLINQQKDFPKGTRT